MLDLIRNPVVNIDTGYFHLVLSAGACIVMDMTMNVWVGSTSFYVSNPSAIVVVSYDCGLNAMHSRLSQTIQLSDTGY